MHLLALLLAHQTALAEGIPADFTPRIFIHIRPEIRTNPGFTADANDTLYSVSQGLRAGLQVQQGHFEGVVDFQGTQAWGQRPGSTSTQASAYVQQGYIQVGTGNDWLRFGRQELHLLNGFHMSRAPWNVAGRSFDGIRGHLEHGDWELDAFSVVLRAPNPEVPATLGSTNADVIEASLGETHAGIFATWTATEDLQVSPITMARFEGPDDLDPLQQLWWVSPGVRILATPGLTRIDLTVLGQVGDHTDTPIRAYSAILRARQGLGDSPLKPGIGLIFEQDSGHACTTDPTTGACTTDTIQDFQTGFGRNHYLRGNADQFRGTNLRDMGLEVDTTLWDGGEKRSFKTAVQGHFFQMVNPEGIWLDATGAVQGLGWEPGNTDPNLAWEVDALMDLRLTKTAHIDGGLCFVQPIGVGERLTGNAPMTYAFARNRFTF